MSTPLPAFATTEQLADWLGEPITEPGDITRAEGALRFASALVRNTTRRTWVDEHGNLPDGLPEDLQLVTLACAARAYTNPDAATSETIDDGQMSRKVDEAGIYLTTSETALLVGYAGTKHHGLSTVGTTRGDVPSHDPRRWVVNGPTIDDGCL